MDTPQDKGRQFEKELAQEFGLKQVPGSGSTWHSKLDINGNGARWSLKFTEKSWFPITMADIHEALDACYGVGGAGETPIWAARVPEGDFIIMRKEDFIALHENDMTFIVKENKKLAARKAKANTPELLREDGDQ
jgi:hypothetical protein